MAALHDRLERTMRRHRNILATGSILAVATLFAAGAQAQTTLYTFNGDSAFDLFGLSVSGAGDVNGDGFADLIVGAIGNDNNGSFSGSARVFSGVDGSVLYTFDGDSAEDHFGWSVSGAGDVNGDGFADLIVGAVFDDNNGSASGSAYVFTGLFNSALSCDIDGDGIDDVDDACPDSDLGETIIIDGVDAGVDNELLEDGCTIADLIDVLLAANPATADVVHFLVALKAEGIITGQDLGATLKALNSP